MTIVLCKITYIDRNNQIKESQVSKLFVKLKTNEETIKDLSIVDFLVTTYVRGLIKY